MPETDKAQQLLSYDVQINQEIHALTEKFSAFPDHEPLDRDRFLDFSRHLDYTESLLCDAAPFLQEVELDPDAPDFYAILKAKANLQKSNDSFHRLRNAFQARFLRKDRSQERELELERTRFYEPDSREEEEPLFPPDSNEPSPEELEAMEQEALMAALEEELALQEEADAKESKRKKEAARQQKHRKAGLAQDEENAREEAIRQEGRRAEAARMGMRVGEGQQLTQADLYSQQQRQELERMSLAQQLEERKRREQETFEAYRERMERSDTYPRAALSSHNDFNPFGGDPTRQLDPTPEAPSYTAPYGDPIPHPETMERMARRDPYPESSPAYEQRPFFIPAAPQAPSYEQPTPFSSPVIPEQGKGYEPRPYPVEPDSAPILRPEPMDRPASRDSYPESSPAYEQRPFFIPTAPQATPYEQPTPFSSPVIPEQGRSYEPNPYPIEPVPGPIPQSERYTPGHTSESILIQGLRHPSQRDVESPRNPYPYRSHLPDEHLSPWKAEGPAREDPRVSPRFAPPEPTGPQASPWNPSPAPVQAQERPHQAQDTRPPYGSPAFQQHFQGAPYEPAPPPSKTGSAYQIPNFGIPSPSGMHTVLTGSSAGLPLAQELYRQQQVNHQSHIPSTGPAPLHFGAKPPYQRSYEGQPAVPKEDFLTNRTLYQSVTGSSPVNTSSKISPAVEQQMIINLQNVRLNFRQASTKEAAIEAAKEYRAERSALESLRSDIRSGRFQVESAQVAAPIPRAPRANTESSPNAVFSTPTPVGVTSQVYSHTKDPAIPATSHVRYDHVTREAKRYSPQNPMRVTPAYDHAILSRYQDAKASMAKLAKENQHVPGFRAPASVEKEFQTASEAYLGYTRAKLQGSVLIDQKAQRNVPDYSAWQQRQRAADMNLNLGAVFGSTAQFHSQNPNRPTKSSTEEVSASVLPSDSLLKRKSMKGAYLKSFGYKAENYTRQAWYRMGRKAYHMLQSSDEDGSASIRTFESGRYYTVTTAHLIYALSHQKGIDPKAMAKRAAKQEYRLFGALSFKDDRELEALVNANGKQAKRAKKLLEFRNKTNLELDLAKNLDQKFGARGMKGRLSIVEEEISKLDRAHYGKLDRSFSAQGMQKAYNREAAKLSRKLGHNVNFDVKGKNLSAMTSKSIAFEIDRLKVQGADLKSYIKQLQSKGSQLSAMDRKLLGKLIQQHKEISVELSRLIGFQKHMENMKIQRDFLTKAYSSMSKNALYYRNGAYMLYGFIIRGMQESQEAGVQGLIKFANISTNHYVHVLVKNSLITSYKTSAWIARKTGMAKAAKSVSLAVSKSVPVTGTKHLIRSQVTRVRSATRTAVKSTKAVAGHLTPQKIRTAKRSISAASAAMKSRYDTLATGIHNAVFRAKAWLANTKFGQGMINLNYFRHNVTQAIGTGFKFAGAAILKFLAAYFLIFLLIGLICGAASVLFGSSSSVILSPDSTEDGAIDLSSYVQIISDAKIELNEKFADMGSKYDDYRVDYISNYDNTKEMLCMMAVYLCQDLDVDGNPKVKEYLNSLFKDSHPYTTTVEPYNCEGCKTRTVSTGHSSSCADDCSASHTTTETYCPGHKRLIISVNVLAFDEIFWADSMGNEGTTLKAGDLIDYYTITYYCPCEICCGEGANGITSSGMEAKPNHTIAIDPSGKIKQGDHVIILGQEYVAEDTGGAIKGNKIDIFVSSHAEALEKGKRFSVPVYVPYIEGGSMEETGEWDGWTDANQEWAKAIYAPNWTELYSGVTDFDGYIETGDLIVEGDFVWPVTSMTNSSGYGWRIHPVTGVRKFHKGTDIPVPVGTPVHAAADGIVTTAKYSDSAGNYVVINHGNGIVTRYLHNSELTVSVGQRVSAGDLIAISGNSGISTGPHLHFEFIVNGTPIDPRKQYNLD